MKKLFLIACAAVVFVGCHSTKKETAQVYEPSGAAPVQYQTNSMTVITTTSSGGGVWTTDVNK